MDRQQQLIIDDAWRLARFTFQEIGDFEWPSRCLQLHGALVVAAKRHGRELQLQAGTAYWPRVSPELDDGVMPTRFGYEWDHEAPATEFLLGLDLMPEMHVWCADVQRMEVVDMTAGFFPLQCKALFGMPWLAPLPPRTFWGTVGDLPRNASYICIRSALDAAYRLLDRILERPVASLSAQGLSGLQRRRTT